MNWFYVVAFGYYWVWMMLMMVVLDCVFVRKFMRWAPYVIAVTLIASVLTANLYIVPGIVFSNMLDFIICIIMCIFVCISYQGIKYHKLSFVVLYFVSTILLEMLITSTIQYISHLLFRVLSPITEVSVQRGVFLWILGCVFLICIFLSKNKNIEFKERKVYILINIFNVTGGLAVVYFTRIYVDPFDLNMMLKWIPFIAFTLVVFALIIWINIISLERRKVDIIQMKTQMLEQNLDSLLKDNRVAEIVRHDMKKHLFIVEQKIVQGQIEEAVEYIHSLEKTLSIKKYGVWTSEILIDSVLNYMKSNAENLGCTVKIDSESLESFALEKEEISVLLLNLLENATEACQKIQEDKRWIHISICTFNEMLSIQIKNSISEMPVCRNGKYVSTKEGEKLHGWGLESVQEIVRRQEGYLKFDVDEKTFEVLVNLPCKIKEDKVDGVK